MLRNILCAAVCALMAAFPAGAADFEVPEARGVPVFPLDEERVNAVCSSPAPVLVLDNFSTGSNRVRASVDLDGDGRWDVGHGEIVSALYEMTGKKVIALNLDSNGSIGHLVELLEPVAARLESGGLKLAAISLSQTIDVPIAAFNRELNLPGEVTPSNLMGLRGKVRRALADFMKRAGRSEYGKLSAIFSRITASGVPIVLAGGNQGAGKVNALGLLPGAISVGALRRDGTRLTTSSDNSTVTVWRLGEHALTAVPGGIDLNGDGKAEFTDGHLSGGESIVGRYVGKRSAGVVLDFPTGRDWDIINRSAPEGIHYLIKKLPEGLYRTEEMIEFLKIPAHLAGALRARGPAIHKTLLFVFSEDGAGRVVYDPAGSGAAGQVGLVSGTSFAAPFICGKPEIRG